MAQTHETIQTRIDGRVAVISLNRPQVLNAINRKLMGEVTAAMNEFVADSQVLAIVLHWLGRAFSAGFDMKESAQRVQMADRKQRGSSDAISRRSVLARGGLAFDFYREARTACFRSDPCQTLENPRSPRNRSAWCQKSLHKRRLSKSAA